MLLKCHSLIIITYNYVDSLDGHLILGCSDLTGRCWNGSLWYYRDPREAPVVEKALTGVDCDNGVVDGRFVGDKSRHLLIGLDHGAVEHVTLSFSDEGEGSVPVEGSSVTPHPLSYFYLERMASVQEHDDIITGLDVTADGKVLVTCSYDGTVVALDVNTLRLESRLKNPQEGLMTNVSTNKVNVDVIATAANDGNATTCDLRTSSEKSVVYRNTADWPTCVEWVPDSEHHLLVGSQTGQVFLYDVREPEKSLSSIPALDKQVYQIKFSPSKPKTFAVSGDTCRVRIADVDDAFNGLTSR